MSSKQPHGIQMPGSILDQIRDRETKGDYEDDKKYATGVNRGNKRKGPEVGRKQKRKEERALKKLKRSGSKVASLYKEKKRGGEKSHSKANKKPQTHAEDDFEDAEIDMDEGIDDDFDEDANGMDEQSTWDALKALKEKKKGVQTTKKLPVKIVKQLEQDEDDFGGFSDDEDDFDDDDFDSNGDDFSAEDDAQTEMSVEETMRALKEAKKGKTTKESKKEVKKAKESKKEAKKSEPKSKTINIKTQLELDDERLTQYYAKKLGISTKDNLKADGDGLESILDGLDFDFGAGDEESEEEMEESGEEFDDLGSEDEDEDSDLESGFESDEERLPKVKENPYVAPVAADSGRYVPPALRRKLLEEAGKQQESEEIKKIKRSINSSLNKLSDANFISIVNNEIIPLYQNNARQTVTECLTDFLLNNITSSPSRLLDSFVIVYAGLVSALYKSQGIEFAAYFIQKLVEVVEQSLANTSNSKQLVNLISLFGFIYNFNVFSSNLTFDIVKLLCEDIDETKIEMLLRLVVISGQKMRLEDPASLREIITLTNKSVNVASANTRAKFLLETLQNVKNNKLKVSDQTLNNEKLVSSLKKQQLTLAKATTSDAIQVTLDDIHNIESKGKWWLVGSAWKGRDDQQKASESTFEVNEAAIDEILDASLPNWGELADFYRMNTSVRRAIFIAIMSSEDFEQLATKIRKLGLKGSQKFEVPKILLVCCSIEPHYNPFYGYVAKEFCKDHDMRKTFQFNLWDLIKEFEGASGMDSDEEEEDLLSSLTGSNESDSEESRLKKILSLGKLYGFLIGQGSLPLLVLKTVNFVTLGEDTKLFMEILLVTFLDTIGKACEISTFGTGSKKGTKAQDLKFDGNKLVEKIPQGQPVLLRGLQYFLQERVHDSEFISGRKQGRRVAWGCDTLCSVMDELLNGQ